MKLKYLILLSISGAIISFDQYTKHLIISTFALGESVSIIPGYFSFTYIRNPGAAFGMMNTWDPQFRIPFFILMPLLALVAILYVFRKIEEKERLLVVTLSLIIGGAIGNLIDRIAYNYVIDFLDFFWRYGAHFPAFNIADSTISIGVALLLFDLIQKECIDKKMKNKKVTK